MKITLDSGTIKEAYMKHTEHENKAVSRQKQAKPPKTDSVNISSDALALAESGKAGQNSRVEKIKASVQNGTYKVDPEVIAEKLLSGFDIPE